MVSDVGLKTPSEEFVGEMDNPNSYWCQPDNNAPSIRDYSQSSRRKNYAELLKLKTRNCNKASSYPGAVSGDVYSQFSNVKNGCCNQRLQSNLKESINSLADVDCSQVLA